MSLAPCRECSKEVSSSARRCPHCGIKHPANLNAQIGSQVWRWGCALFVFVPLLLTILLAALAGAL